MVHSRQLRKFNFNFLVSILRRIKMKKLVLSLILGASLAIAPSAFALKAMSADNMKDTTGQGGVRISLADVGIHSTGGDTTYTFGNDGNTVLKINSGESFMHLTAVASFTGLMGNGQTFNRSPLDISIGEYAGNPGAESIIIGLPTIAIYKTGGLKTYSIGASGQLFCTIEKGESTTTITGGKVFIWAY
jgi:hypothetical protein